MSCLRNLMVRIFRLRNRHAEQKVRDAERGLQSAKVQAQHAHRHIVQPGINLRDENNFANIVRESLRIGHKEN